MTPYDNRNNRECPICGQGTPHCLDEINVDARRWAELASENDLFELLPPHERPFRDWPRVKAAGREVRRRLTRAQDELSMMAAENVTLAAKLRLIGRGVDVALAEIEAVPAVPPPEVGSAIDAATARIAELERALLSLMPPHSGLCCTLDEAGAVVVTIENCRCTPTVKRARAALAGDPR